MNKIITSKMGNTSMPNIKFTIQNEQNNFSIYYLDNQDLYFSTYTNQDETLFTIEREDYELYQAFNNLFSNLKTNRLFKYTKDIDLGHDYNSWYIEWIEKLKKLLYDEVTKTITFVSNDLIDPRKPDRFSLQITEQDLSYKVIFQRPSDKESKKFCSIRFNTNRSDYGPLIILFTNFYRDLKNFNEYYQYSINDYLETTKVKQKTLKI